ncbi:cytoplasmic polyadenylation element-binding protein 3 [Trichonephila inaurata madagascariensis]|uniref:Cytoplasmic polyadenylation element-binding protein 3 n=1 Tax=Trichonephila inaurata madagascariensis TaxID=2747483 RepID=A0A8X6XET9_9ARAC|nr:cytoplasmic polyadenylation element-binding protein 3 [Trichonephila inaurata madagascariensis]
MGEYNFTIQSSVTALSPVNYQPNPSVKPFFNTDSRNMQDELLLDKNNSGAAGKQTESQQQSSPNQENLVNNGDVSMEEYANSKSKNEDLELSVNNQMEKQMMEASSTSGTPSSTLPLEFPDASITTSAPNFWSGVATEDGFPPGVPPLKNTLQFQNFPNANPVFNSSLGSQISIPQSLPSQRRAITGAHNFSQTRHQPPPQSNILKTFSNWSNPQSASWSAPQTPNGLIPWNAMNLANQKRTVPNINPVCPQKKNPAIGQHSMVISPSKFRRSTSLPLGKQFPHAFGGNPAFDMTALEENRDGNMMFPFQDHQVASNMNTNMEALRFPLEQQLLDLMRTNAEPQEHFKGYMNYAPNNIQSMGNIQGSSVDFASQKYNGTKKFPRARNYGRRRGKPGRRSPFFTGIEDNHVLDDQLDQIVTSFNTLHMSPNTSRGSESGERYSRKVFVGGLPPDIDEEEITASFRRFGPLVVDWPHKAESKSYFPPKGYAFLLFQDESSVQSLIDACIQEDEKLYLCVSSPTIKDKPVQIRPWRLSDADFVLDASMPLDPRKTVFVGGVPRPLKAVELAMIMDRLYGGVCYAGIDTDPELKYPKGAGRVAFSNQQSYIAAISARFVQLQHGDIEKRVEVKPYVLDDQMCDECQGSRCGGKFAPFFCANVTCLQYYCEHCWATIHSRPGREFHKPLVKEGADRPRAVPFRWC